MSPRPRTLSDEQILAAAVRVMGRVPPTRLTLSDIAQEAGLAPATLVQRFGSKRDLLLTLAGASARSMDACFTAAREAHASPLAALLAAATVMTRFTATPEEMGNQLAWLQIDLSDPDFHRHMLAGSRRTLAGYRQLLDDAVRAGELKPCDTAALARAVAALAPGSLISWAVHRKGSAERWVRDDLQTLLAPYRTDTGPARGGPRAGVAFDGSEPGPGARTPGRGGRR